MGSMRGRYLLRLARKTLSLLLIARLIFQLLLPPAQPVPGGVLLERFPVAVTLGTGISRLSGWLVAPVDAGLRLTAEQRPALKTWLPRASIPEIRKRYAGPARRHLPPVLARQFSNASWDHVLPGVADFGAALTWVILAIAGSALGSRRSLRKLLERNTTQQPDSPLLPPFFAHLLRHRGEVHSRRAFLEKVKNEYAEARASRIPVGLLIVESDHAATKAGRIDRQLRRRLAREITSGGAWCRFGPGDFAVWVPGAEEDQAIRLSQALASRIEGLSIGLCHAGPGFGMQYGLHDYQALIGIANERLKQARSRGGGISSNCRGSFAAA